jgi:dual-specificity kinase
LVFEQLGPSLYDIIKRNKYVGFPPRQVKSFARQLLESIAFMHRCGYTHTDLKPENILLCSDSCSEEKRDGKPVFFPKSTRIKLIDFGGANHERDSKSSIINTRQYRAPEVILQCCRWDHASDVWSLGCIFVEMATGNLLFPVHNDIDHIYMIDKIAGKFPGWMAEQA